MRRALASVAAVVRLAGVAAAVAWSYAAAAEIRLADDRGREIVLPRAAARIVTLAPHLTEIAFAAGAGAKLVGVSAYSDFPPEAARLPVVSDHGKVNFEEIAALQPDLALMWTSGNRAPDFERLEARGVRVFATEARRPEDIARILRLVGRLAGTEPVADAAARDLEAHFGALRERYRGRPPVSVFYEIWPEPLMTVNRQHLISYLVELCGGRNVFADAGPLTPTISREQVLAADPDAVLVAAPAPRAAGRIDGWRAWRALRAGREGRVFAVDPAAAHRMSPRIVDGAAELCATLERARR
jgi:iron complex transport system substrate-binding protein